MRRNHNCARLVLVFHLAYSLGWIIVRVTAKPPSWGTNIFNAWGNTDTNDKQWSSMLTVDPSKIISLMIQHGGLLLPKYFENDLNALSQICHAERVQLNVVERKLLVHNFTVHLPDQEDAIRVGRVYLQWDSYLRPCVDIEVDDVDIFVEFMNVLLTKNNWDELRKNGFPPGFLTEEGETSSQTNSFLRIGSIDLSGNITACIKSRPLKKELAEIKFELDAFDPLDREIRNQSMENLATLGRRGCNTDELYSLVQAYFMKIFRQILSETLEDLSKGGTDTAKEVDRAINWTKDSLKKYVGDAGGWTGEQIQGKVAGRLEKWGKSVENLSDTHKSVLELARRIQQKTFKDSNDEATSPT